MAIFEYIALDKGGRSCKGILSGDSQRHIRTQLRDSGLSPVEVKPLAQQEVVGSHKILQKKISVSKLALMTRQLATLVRAGMPLEEALYVLGSQAKHQTLQAVIAGLRSSITEGETFSRSLSKYPNIFPEYYWTMVQAGEVSGGLDDILERLADYTEQQQYLRQKLSASMIYPVILISVSLTVVIALLTYVIPEIVRVFEQTGQTLPLLTDWLITCSNFIRNNGLIIISIIILMTLTSLKVMQQISFRKKRDNVLLSLPFVGDMVRTINSARLARILSILVESGVTLTDSLNISLQIIRNIPIREAVKDSITAIREGGRLHHSMHSSGYFSPLMVHMVSVGEESGELEAMLARAATHHERELNTMITAATSLIEPILILVMGGFVLIIVLAILLPIFEMNQLVGI